MVSALVIMIAAAMWLPGDDGAYRSRSIDSDEAEIRIIARGAAEQSIDAEIEIIDQFSWQQIGPKRRFTRQGDELQISVKPGLYVARATADNEIMLTDIDCRGGRAYDVAFEFGTLVVENISADSTSLGGQVNVYASYSMTPVSSRRIGNDGRAVFHLRPGEYAVSIRHENSRHDPGLKLVEAGRQATIKTSYGTLRLTPSGAGMTSQRCKVVLLSTGQQDFRHVFDLHGRRDVILPDGDYVLYFSVGGLSSQGSVCTVKAGMVESVDIGFGTIVAAITSPDKDDVPGVLELRNPFSGVSYGLRTDRESATASISAPPGNYHLEYAIGEFKSRWPDAVELKMSKQRTVSIETGQVVIKLPDRLAHEGGLRLLLHNEAGIVRDLGRHTVGDTTTVNLDLPEGRYRLTIDGEGVTYRGHLVGIKAGEKVELEVPAGVISVMAFWPEGATESGTFEIMRADDHVKVAAGSLRGSEPSRILVSPGEYIVHAQIGNGHEQVSNLVVSAGQWTSVSFCLVGVGFSTIATSERNAIDEVSVLQTEPDGRFGVFAMGRRSSVLPLFDGAYRFFAAGYPSVTIEQLSGHRNGTPTPARYLRVEPTGKGEFRIRSRFAPPNDEATGLVLSSVTGDLNQRRGGWTYRHRRHDDSGMARIDVSRADVLLGSIVFRSQTSQLNVWLMAIAAAVAIGLIGIVLFLRSRSGSHSKALAMPEHAQEPAAQPPVSEALEDDHPPPTAT